MSDIAKFRDSNHPGRWWLTDFTMEQIETRLDFLEESNVHLQRDRERLEALAKILANRRRVEFDMHSDKWFIEPDKSHKDAIEVQCPKLVSNFRETLDIAMGKPSGE